MVRHAETSGAPPQAQSLARSAQARNQASERLGRLDQVLDDLECVLQADVEDLVDGFVQDGGEYGDIRGR
ncbi:ubiquitin-like protein Pup [Bifidobacterium xylocopae]|uniref:Prokaryotic ubiquitin-like protein Pup n=1 Tax=Bifidobacterium xylocopae TaxID=2493119 RepID=A0A366KDX8_9BIFI|nr:ubiquitin-like protein Pup [Bifidobacterium xylocopae]RBP99935.1 ubiquitin [Bifidobacterium xylocopae]